MSRSGYVDDCDYLPLYRQAVERSLKGIRGQAFLREMAEALDAMPCKRLTTGELVDSLGDVCALGCVCQRRGINCDGVDSFNTKQVAKFVGISEAMAAEIADINDDDWLEMETDWHRWTRVRKWVAEQIVVMAQ